MACVPVVLMYPTSGLKFIQKWVPAYARYFAFVGMAGEPGPEVTAVQVYGWSVPEYSRPVMVRKSVITY